MAGKIAFAGLPARRGAQPAKAPPKRDLPAPLPPLPPALDSTDVLELVLDKIEVRDLAAAAQVSRQWRAASLAADSAWRRAFVTDFGEGKAADYPRQRTWRDKYIACQLDSVCHKLRSKARQLDELEDSCGVLEKNSHVLLARLSQIDRTLSHRRHDLSVLLASVTGRAATHAADTTPRGREILQLAASGGDAARYPRLSPALCASLTEAERDVELWRQGIAEERQSLHRLWDNLARLRTAIRLVRRDIGRLQKDRALLQAATNYRPNVRRS